MIQDVTEEHIRFGLLKETTIIIALLCRGA